MIKESSHSSFNNDALQSDSGRVTVFFYSDLVETCVKQENIIEEVNSNYDDMMTFVKINYDENIELANSYNIFYANVYMYYINGREVSKFEKVDDSNALIKKISLDHDYTGITL
jgi:thioredoxin-like negative regulator of GroEL